MNLYRRQSAAWGLWMITSSSRRHSATGLHSNTFRTITTPSASSSSSSSSLHFIKDQNCYSNSFLYSFSSKAKTSIYTIADEVTEQMKLAMKAKDTARLATIRLIRSSFGNAAIDLKVDTLNDEQAIGVLRKMAKMRVDSIKMYKDNGVLERAQAEQNELSIIESWLPTVADEDTTRKWVLEAIKITGTDNVGKIMGALMKAHRTEIDGTTAQKLVKEEIANAKQS